MDHSKIKETTEARAFLDAGVFARIVDCLCESEVGLSRSHLGTARRRILPSRTILIEMIERLRTIFFPGYFGTTNLTHESVRFHQGAALDWVQQNLLEQIRRGLCFVCEEETPQCSECEAIAVQMAESFITQLPEIRHFLATDVHAAFEGDPAATSPAEVIFCYPGIVAITNHRIAHALYKLKVPLIPRLISEHAHSITGIDIHPGAQINTYFFIDHGTGVVIGETCNIGKHVSIYQGVTLGAKSFPLDAEGNPIKGIPRHPLVEDKVVIYGGATVLGRVTIGQGSMIGGNVWLTESVAPGSKITQPRTIKPSIKQSPTV